MADKEIKIDIKTTADTAGAKAAEQSIEAMGKKAEVASRGFGGMLDGVPERIDEVSESTTKQAAASEKVTKIQNEYVRVLGQVEEQLTDITEAADQANDEGSKLEENVDSISRAQKAQVFALLAQSVGQIGDRFREAADEVEEFDKTAADSLRRTADLTENISTAVTQLALGFAVGGPLGAGIAGVALAIGALADAWQDSEVAAIKASANTSAALMETATAARQVALEARNRAEELERGEIEEAIHRQNRALEHGLKLLLAQVAAVRKRRQEEERVFQADDEVDLAKIDEDEAKGLITKEEAETARAEVKQRAVERRRAEEKKRAVEDAELARKAAEKEMQDFRNAEKNVVKSVGRIEDKEAGVADAERLLEAAKAGKELRDLQEKEEKLRSSDFSTAGQVQKAIIEREQKQNQIKSNGFTTRELNTPVKSAEASLGSAINNLEEEKGELEKLRKDFEAKSYSAYAANETAAVAERDRDATISTVDRVATREDKATETRKSAESIRQQNRERQKAQREALRKEAEDKKEELQDLASSNRDRILKSRQATTGPRAKEVQDLANAVGKADTLKELNELSRKLEGTGGATVKALQGMIKAQESLVKQIQNIGERVKRIEGK